MKDSGRTADLDIMIGYKKRRVGFAPLVTPPARAAPTMLQLHGLYVALLWQFDDPTESVPLLREGLVFRGFTSPLMGGFTWCSGANCSRIVHGSASWSAPANQRRSLRRSGGERASL